MLEEQIPYVDNEQDAILLSVGKWHGDCYQSTTAHLLTRPTWLPGGNDAELSNILNACIFQWLHINKVQELLIKIDGFLNEAEQLFGWLPNWDLDRMARTCDEQLSRTEGIINSQDFSNKLDNVVNAAKAKLSFDGRIYWTGYAKFFGTDLTLDCNSVSWTVFIHVSLDPIFPPGAPLCCLVIID